jgi:uncharacterized membrane protein
MSALTNPGREAIPIPRWRAMILVVMMGLVLAGIVHIIVVLLIPRFADNDAYALLAERGRQGQAELVRTTDTRIIAHDPATVISVCAYDLADGPLMVAARRGGLPLAITLHQPGGGVFYAVTDRAAIRGTITFMITTRAQMAERIAQEDEGEVEREFRVLAPATQGLVVTRVLVRRESERQEAEALATATSCTSAD